MGFCFKIDGAPELQGNRFGCLFGRWQAERLTCNTTLCYGDTCRELFERKLELPKRRHIRARLWFASQFAEVR